ncbi:MAG: tRNA (N6-isopentenyl adenosine(37)-C2)-methylthiotransferase MiaB [Anaerovoracaceae bacterium]|nr:tRNA (N6-isopentenyl adenosine(37)-C2)-methylthiotransferase MiaB [Bacillota bacterium]MDY2670027.1 tRNA (N6-isopentenyl adenosine(37)-C2)-methylthiotransferase MiaB [Anaerovoracaceae bacterium]
MYSDSRKRGTYFIQTFGCQMNERDSETIAGMLEDDGYVKAEERDGSDVIIINTCSVRENADNRFFGQLGVIKKIKEKNPDSIVAVCGCMMQQKRVTDIIKDKYSWVDIIFGTMNIDEFPSLLRERRELGQHEYAVADSIDHITEGLPSRRKFKFKSFVNIMNGCNNFCTYCIVPYTRGREKSRPPEAIIAEIKRLADDGVKEITLLGQNVNSYGKADGFDSDFADLLYRIEDIDGIERVRFMTSHPKDCSDDLIKTFGRLDKLCPHIHLPVQSGSSRLLKKMNRRYTKEKYLELLAKLRDVRSDIAVTTDIIVGFPGETDEDFEETMDLVQKARFDSAFTFLYSKREGTPAAEYEDQVPDELKHARFNRLVDAINAISAEKNAAYEGRVEKILIEGRSARGGEGTCSGRTGTFKLVNFKCDESRAGQMADVKITDAGTFSLFGELV